MTHLQNRDRERAVFAAACFIFLSGLPIKKRVGAPSRTRFQTMTSPEKRICQLPHKRKQRGATLLLFTLMAAMLLIPVIGLAVDGSICFWMKAKLSAAVDAAALATARGLNVGQTLSAQTAAATTTGDTYFAANFPAGIMGTSVVGGRARHQCSARRTTIR